eukprot:SAG11_NODE_9825_length_878_cov_1.105263_1_plen_91_part_00
MPNWHRGSVVRHGRHSGTSAVEDKCKVVITQRLTDATEPAERPHAPVEVLLVHLPIPEAIVFGYERLVLLVEGLDVFDDLACLLVLLFNV